MEVLLFLDDKRNPFLDPLYTVASRTTRIIWVRNFEEFKEYFLRGNSLPDVVSFDHDLHDEHYTPERFWDNYDESKKYQEEKYLEYKHETGKGCAEFMLKHYRQLSEDLPTILVHSANPVGRDMILSVFR